MSTLSQDSSPEKAVLVEQAHYLHSAFESLDVYVFATDLTGKFSYANQKFCEFIALEQTQLLQKNVKDLSFSCDLSPLFDADQRVIEQKFSVEKETIVLTLDNSTRYFQLDKKPLLDAAGQLVGVLTIFSDISDKKNAEQALRNSLRVLRVLAQTGDDQQRNIFELIVQQLAQSQGTKYAMIAHAHPVLENHVKTIAVWGDGKLLDNFTYSLDGTPCNIVMGDDICYFKDNVQSLFPKDLDLVAMNARSYIGAPLSDRFGNSVGILALLDDKPFQENKHSLELLESLAARASIELQQLDYNRQKKLYSEIFNASHDALVITDADYAVIDTNPAYSRITGYSAEEVLGNKSVFKSDTQDKAFYQDREAVLQSKGFWQGEMWGRKKNGETYAQLLTITTVLNTHQEVTNYVGLFSDITETKRQQEKLKLLAHYDPLTNLANRVLLIERFAAGVEYGQQHGEKMALCFIDLDGFKAVNDQFGHEVGDKLLMTVAKRIQNLVRNKDTVSRQGGDEFAILLRDIESREQCESIVANIHQSLASPYNIEEVIHHISASSGVALYPEDGADIDTLLRRSDQAMYQAKLAGKNRFQFFKSLSDVQKTSKERRLSEMQQALLNQEFELYYQPKVNIATGVAYGVEALIRWIHPHKGIIPPLDFLPFIQGTEFEIELGLWVIDSALHQLSQWLELGFYLEVSINVSSNQMLAADFVTDIQNLIGKHELCKPELVQLEILESAALNDINVINKIIGQCQDVLGLSVALDDFGTGYSSLAHLRRLSANTIKIDRSFVFDVLDDPSDCAIIEGILSLANAFGRQVVAEGVETFEHGLMLLLMGCERVQGYGIARPMPAAEVAQWLDSYRPDDKWLSLAGESVGYKQRRLKIFELVLVQWKQKFLKKVTLGLESKQNWPIMNRNKCACGAWLIKVKQDRLLSQASCNLLEIAHKEFHSAAESALNEFHKEQSGDVTKIAQQLDLLVEKMKVAVAQVA